MQKTNVNTALTIFFIATAVVLIGGLAIVPTIMQSASANHGGRHDFYPGEGSEGNKREFCTQYPIGDGGFATQCSSGKGQCEQVSQQFGGTQCVKQRTEIG
jgi:hypothetical protein